MMLVHLAILIVGLSGLAIALVDGLLRWLMRTLRRRQRRLEAFRNHGPNLA